MYVQDAMISLHFFLFVDSLIDLETVFLRKFKCRIFKQLFNI